jgi:ribosomal protein S18 acetylase RimI-like enzyme
VDYFFRPAEKDDFSSLNKFLSNEACILHRHLDWHLPTDWLGSQPFWILGRGDEIIAALAFPADPPDIAWVRLFAASPRLRLSQTWKLLFEKCLAEIEKTPRPTIASLALKKSYSDILIENGFRLHQRIVVLELSEKKVCKPILGNFTIRPMSFDDLPVIVDLDKVSFEPLWHNSINVLSLAYNNAAYATVVENGGRIIAYQISTSTLFNAHLARIAVHPEIQHNGIGLFILQDMVDYFTSIGIGKITINTQHDNKASLALYQKSGFRLTGESFPVYFYIIPQEI